MYYLPIDPPKDTIMVKVGFSWWFDDAGNKRQSCSIFRDGVIDVRIAGVVKCKVVNLILTLGGCLPLYTEKACVQEAVMFAPMKVLHLLSLLASCKKIRWDWFKDAETLDDIEKKLATKVVLGVVV
jgi:hypothetical protein